MAIILVAAVVAVGGVFTAGSKSHTFTNDTTYQDTVQFEEAAAFNALQRTRRIEQNHPEWEKWEPASQPGEVRPMDNTAPGAYY